jgi:hypothetical protein
MAPECPTCGTQDAEHLDRKVRALEQRISELEAENLRLTAASNYFGALAERLNERLKQRPPRRTPATAAEAARREPAHNQEQS